MTDENAPPALLPFAAFLAERLNGRRQVVVVGGTEVTRWEHTADIEIVTTTPAEPGALHDSGVSVPIPPAERHLVDNVLLVWEPLAGSPDRAVTARSLSEQVSRAALTVVASPQERPLGPLLRSAGIEPAFFGFARSSEQPSATRDIDVAVIENPNRPLSIDSRPDPGFKVVAVLIVYNEEDVIESTIRDLFDQGVHTYVIDNWSTDRTFELAARHLGESVVGLERSPVDGPPDYFDLKSLLLRLEEVTRIVQADWFIKHDADEARRSPWPDVTLREGLWRAQQAGYNCVDFTVLNFRPVDNGFPPGSSYVDYFRHFEFGRKPGYFRQLKAWRDFGQSIEYARFGSHRIDFDGLKVFPYKFLLRHYPIRSQQHGERKIFDERLERFLPDARRRGWHTQYDSIERGSSLIADQHELLEFDEEHFSKNFLIERLTGVGIDREPVPETVPEPGRDSARKRRRFFRM